MRFLARLGMTVGFLHTFYLLEQDRLSPRADGVLPEPDFSLSLRCEVLRRSRPLGQNALHQPGRLRASLDHSMEGPPRAGQACLYLNETLP